MLRFHRLFYCTPHSRFRFRKPQAVLHESEGAKARLASSLASMWAQPREARTPPAHRSRTRQLNPASHIAQPPQPSRQNPRTNVHFSLFLTKSCRLCVGFGVGVAYHSNAGAQPPEGTVQFVAQQNPPPLTFKVATIATSTPREENLWPTSSKNQPKNRQQTNR